MNHTDTTETETTWQDETEYIDTRRIYYVFGDFPIASLHPQAQKAHESARCARELGGDEAFWTMHDLLFVNQSYNIASEEGSAWARRYGLRGHPASLLVNEQGQEQWRYVGVVSREVIEAELTAVPVVRVLCLSRSN